MDDNAKPINKLQITKEELEGRKKRLAKAKHNLGKLQVASKLALDAINTYTEEEMISFLEALYKL